MDPEDRADVEVANALVALPRSEVALAARGGALAVGGRRASSVQRHEPPPERMVTHGQDRR